jgi:hypothetical protein
VVFAKPLAVVARNCDQLIQWSSPVDANDLPGLRKRQRKAGIYRYPLIGDENRSSRAYLRQEIGAQTKPG